MVMVQSQRILVIIAGSGGGEVSVLSGPPRWATFRLHRHHCFCVRVGMPSSSLPWRWRLPWQTEQNAATTEQHSKLRTSIHLQYTRWGGMRRPIWCSVSWFDGVYWVAICIDHWIDLCLQRQLLSMSTVASTRNGFHASAGGGRIC